MRRRTFFTLISICLLMSNSCAADDDSREQLRQAHTRVANLEYRIDGLKKALSDRQQLLQQLNGVSEQAFQRRQTLTNSKKRLAALTSLRQEFSKWSDASLVVGNRNAATAVALKNSDSGYVLTSIARGPMLRYAISAAEQSRVRQFANPPEQRMVNKLLTSHHLVREDLPYHLNTEDSATVASLGYRGPVLTGKSMYMVYHDPEADKQRVAVYETTNGHTAFLTLVAEQQEVAQRALVGGSCIAGDAEAVEPHLEAGEPFLDYCALSVLRALYTEQNHRVAPAVAVSVSLGRGLGSMKAAERTSWFDRYVTSQHQSQRTQSEAVVAFGREMHDELRNRLVRRNVYVVERELSEVISVENSYRSGSRDLSKQMPVEASHVLALKIDSTKGGTERMSLRLIDRISQNTVWSATDRNTILPSRSWQNYLVQSGSPVIVKFRDSAAARRFAAFADVQRGQSSQEFVAVLEKETSSQIELRSLFSGQTVSFSPFDVTTSPITADGTTLAKEFDAGPLSREVIPLVTYRFAKHLLAPASRLTALEQTSDRWAAILGIGTQHSLSPGDRFRLLSGDGNRVLPMGGTLTDILSTDKSRLTLPGWQADNASRDPNKLLAVCDTWKETSVAMFLPTVSCDKPQLKTYQHLDKYDRLKRQGDALRPTIRDTLFKSLTDRGVKVMTAELSYHVPADWKKWWGESRARQLAVLFDSINQEQMAQDAGEMGATHVIGGKMKRLSPTKWQVTLALAELHETTTGNYRKGDSVDSITFAIRAQNSMLTAR